MNVGNVSQHSKYPYVCGISLIREFASKRGTSLGMWVTFTVNTLTSVESPRSEGLSVTELELSSGMGGLAMDMASSSSE